MLKLVGRKMALSLGLAVTLAFSSLASAWGTLDVLTLVCPNMVWAGQPINGYAAGGEVPMSVHTGSMFGPLPGTPLMGPGDPLPFSVPTNELMIGTIVTITAGDRTGQNAFALVFII